MEGLQGGRAVGVLVGVEAGAAEDGGGEAQQPRLDEGELAQREDEEEEAAEDEGPEQVGLGGDQDPLGHVLEQQHQPRPHTLHTQIDNINKDTVRLSQCSPAPGAASSSPQARAPHYRSCWRRPLP